MRYCAAPHCPVLVDNGRCHMHACSLDLMRGTATERGYDYAWSRYSKVFLSQHPICGERADGTMDRTNSRCVQQGRLTPAQCVDHTIPMVRGGDKWAPTNHMSACRACNAWKAATIERMHTRKDG